MLKILIIDDDNIVLLVQRKLLERCGFHTPIFSFTRGEKALEFLKEEHSSQPFLIFLDINMPGMNGWQFLNEIRNRKVHHTIYVIMVTSSINQLDKEMAEKYENVIGFMEKPVTAKDCLRIKGSSEIKRYFKND